MSRAPVLVVLVVLASVAACRMNFDPLGQDPDTASPSTGSATGSGTTSQPIVAAPGTELVTACTPGVPCMVDCSQAASCIVDCNGASSCDVLCAAADCLVEACTAPACEVDCGPSGVIMFDALATCG